jgi:DNA mismatch repair protein MutS
MTHAADSIHSIDPATLTPAMRQYQQYKQQYPDAVLFFRIGDFYECFYEDARTVARTLGVALTARSKGENPVPMAGVPYHAVETYLHRMVAAGFKVAICEQMENPKDAKGVIKREVTRLVTPGTLTEEAMLDGREENFLAAVVTQDSDLAAIAWCDLSTGKFLTFTGTLAACGDQLARLRPRELIHAEAADHRPSEWLETLRTQLNTTLSGRPAWQLDPHHAAQTLKAHYAVATFAGFGYENEKDLALRAAGGLVAYLHETQKSLLEHLQPPSAFEQSNHLLIDPVSLRSLEVLRTLRGNTVEGSLVAAIDRTSTPMGSRLLRNWLCYPLCDLAQIRKRQDAIEQLATAEAMLAQIRTILADCSDIERITARICCRRASPRDLVALARSIEALVQAAKILKPTRDNEPTETPAHNAELIALVPPAKQLADHIRCCLPDEPPAHLRDGNVIKDGCNADLDRLRALSRDSRTFLAEYQSKLIARSNISSLKVGYNKVFGFYIEVTNVHAEKIPADFIRKQTVKNAERYITPELKQYESEILTAQERSLALEQELFEQLRNHLAAQVHTLQRLAASAATLDVTAGLAHLARTRHYCRPVLTAEKILAITDGRHPVVEQSLGEKFVPNDTAFGQLSVASGQLPDQKLNTDHRPLTTLHVITGPNMAGKSTYIRQVALLVLMAQAGSFIPAKSATLGIVDRIFTRVGAADDLAQGQSTFMVEMIETANILHHATESSLVILDEIGRGTSTLDGLALAWAIAEFLADTTKARTLFATHYHELTELAETSKAVANYNVLVREWEDQVIFMHRIAPGQADKSYGVHVARLAGVPRSVVTRARQLMTQLVVHVGKTGSRPKAASPTVAPQIGIFDPIDQQALTQLRALDMNRMSPMQAWEALRTLQGMLEEKKGQ